MGAARAGSGAGDVGQPRVRRPGLHSSALDKLRAIRSKIDALGKPIRLEIDGGVKADNIGAIAAAGADTFVAGSAIFNAPDYAQIIAQMRAAVDAAR